MSGSTDFPGALNLPFHGSPCSRRDAASTFLMSVACFHVGTQDTVQGRSGKVQMHLSHAREREHLRSDLPQPRERPGFKIYVKD